MKKSTSQLTLVLTVLLGLSSVADATTATDDVVRMLGCRACHRIAGNGGQFGPDLAGVGQRLTGDQLQRKLQSPDTSGNGPYMPAFNYLTEGELQQLLDTLERL